MVRFARGLGGATRSSDVLLFETDEYTAESGYEATKRALASGAPFTVVAAFNGAIGTGRCSLRCTTKALMCRAACRSCRLAGNTRATAGRR